MDLVYLHRKDKVDMIRYSLRSAEKFIIHDRVWVIGDLCDWMQGVHHIPFKDSGTPQRNTLWKFYVAASHPAISKQCIIMHDDFILLSEYNPVIYHSGLLAGKAQRSKGERAVKFTRTCQHIPGAKSFELHYPMPADREELRAAMDKCDWKRGIAPYSLYGNLQKTFPIEEREDCKNRKTKDFLSTYNETESDIDFLQQLFPTKSQYEL